MASIATYLQKILAAVYGEEVRSSIHDALAAMNVESSNAMQYASTAKDSAQASATKAESSATIAAQKASDASASATEADTSAKAAESFQISAESKASEASDSATRAKASEIAASNSEATAIQKAEEAADSRAAAAMSEMEAKSAEERSKAIKMDVEATGAQVEADRIASNASKNAAEAARDAADLSEIKAHNSANTALNAAAAAEIFKDDAQTAATIAQSARTSAETAKNAAEKARDDAQNDADDAAQAAIDAAASALSAQQYSGKPPKPQDGTWWIWDADKQTYVDSGISCELVGPIGIGVKDIQLTKGDHTPGTTDIYTVTLTNDSTYNISVYNGRNGTGTGDVLGIWFDLVIPAAGWKDGEITIADERFLALSTNKYFLSASQASREEFLECNVQPKDITTTGFITFTNDTDPTEDLTVNLIRFELSANGERDDEGGVRIENQCDGHLGSYGGG